MQFLRTMLASTLGVMLAFLIVFLIVFISLLTAQRDPEPYVHDGTVLKMDLSGDIPERQAEDPFQQLFSPELQKQATLKNITENLEKAAVDERIEGVWLDLGMVGASWARVEEVREHIQHFREDSGKFVYASTDDAGINEQGYYLATAADSVFAPPHSQFMLSGFYMQTPFLEGLLERIGAEAEVMNTGDYKTSMEPFTNRQYSEPNREQLQAIIDRVSHEFITQASEFSGLEQAEIHRILNEAPRMTSEFGYEAGFLDELIYPSELQSRLEQRVTDNGNRRMRTIENHRYAQISRSSAGLSEFDHSQKIGVIYAQGPIMPQLDGGFPSQQQAITASRIESQLNDIREDDAVKAVVLRINSPGGAVSTSELIWRMLRDFSREEEIPVIASMGDTAASGGYYIATGADTIVASPGTITGSIGVISTGFNAAGMFNEHLGIHFDEVKSHEHADWMSMTRGFEPAERQTLTQLAEEAYLTFLQRAADSQDMSIEEVRELAQGRVWTGQDARDNGLVDETGGMDRALEIAAERADITDYAIEVYPKPKTLLEMFSVEAGTRIRSLVQPDFPGWKEYETLYEHLDHQGRAMAIMPFEIRIK